MVTQFRDIAKFKATKHNMQIQVRRDPGKECLQLRFCVMEEDVEMVTKVDVGSTKKTEGDKAMPKNLKPNQMSAQQKKGSVSKKDAQEGTKDTSPASR
jgi:hypothetical protein